MITLRMVVAMLMFGVAPQDRLPEIGVEPADWSEHAHALAAANRHREAIAAFQRAMQAKAAHSRDYAWQIAKSYAQLGNRKQAVRWVEHALRLGFADHESIRKAPEFVKFADDTELNRLLREKPVSNLRIAL